MSMHTEINFRLCVRFRLSFFTFFVKVLPLSKLSSSTLHTIIFGLILNKPKLDKNLFSYY